MQNSNGNALIFKDTDIFSYRITSIATIR